MNTVIKNYIPIITQTQKKKDEDFFDITDRLEKDNNEFLPASFLRKHDKKYTEYKLSNKNFNLDKFQKNNLFFNKKISTTLEKSQIQKAFEGANNDINGNNNNVRFSYSNSNIKFHFDKLESKKKVYNRNSSIGRLSSGKNFWEKFFYEKFS